MTATIERLVGGDELRAIADPRDRLAAAGEAIEHAERLGEQHRLRRNAAAVELYRRTVQVGPGEVVRRDGSHRRARNEIDISRTLWTRILDQVEPDFVLRQRAAIAALEVRAVKASGGQAKELEREITAHRRAIRRAEELGAAVAAVCAELDALPHDEAVERARVIASESAEQARRCKQLIQEVQPIRNETAVGLTDGLFEGVPRMRNADVARLGRFTTARVAQLRGSY